MMGCCYLNERGEGNGRWDGGKYGKIDGNFEVR